MHHAWGSEGAIALNAHSHDWRSQLIRIVWAVLTLLLGKPNTNEQGE